MSARESRYRIVHVDLANLEPLRLSHDETGIALIVRLRGELVGFVMRAATPGETLSAQLLGDIIAVETGVDAVRSVVRPALAPVPEASPAPALTIAICTKDHPELAERCIRAALRLRERARLLEVLVVDNAPSDERTAVMVSGFKDVRYVREPKPGLDFARNRAWREARGELVAFIDDDAVLDPGWLDGLMRAWRVHPDAGMFTGLVLPYALDTRAQVMFEARGGFRRGFARLRYAGDTMAGNAWYPAGAGIFGAGCNMVIRRELLESLGGFDDALDTGAPLPGGGDLDIFYRTIRSGAPLVYEPSMLVFHEHRRELDRLRRQYYTWGLGFVAFVVKTWRTDPTQRRKLFGLMGWWTKYELKGLARAILGRGPLPASFVAAEMYGGLVGLLGGYRRSLRRTRRIREAHA
jgi:GT2 family glycosyltransferase